MQYQRDGMRYLRDAMQSVGSEMELGVTQRALSLARERGLWSRCMGIYSQLPHLAPNQKKKKKKKKECDHHHQSKDPKTNPSRKSQPFTLHAHVFRS